VASQFTLDGDVSTLGEVAGEVSQLPEGVSLHTVGAAFIANHAGADRRPGSVYRS
jgi:hypothetical protein